MLGTGALGCVFAARLAPLADVTLLGTWPEGLAAVTADGVTLHLPDGGVQRVRVDAASDPAAAAPADVALVLVKSFQSKRAALWAQQALAPGGLAVTLQNGLDAGPILAAAVGRTRSATGVTYNGATLLGPGEVSHAALQPTFLGRTPETAARVNALAALLTEAGLPACGEDNIAALVWAKAIANAAINPLAALWRVPNGELISPDQRFQVLSTLAGEAAVVAGALGVTPLPADPAAHAAAVCRATAANRASMLQDIERGRLTEIDSINGVIVREGARHGIAAPMNATVWRLVGALSARGEEYGWRS